LDNGEGCNDDTGSVIERKIFLLDAEDFDGGHEEVSMYNMGQILL
jgi:hypothetical protein